MKTAIMKKREEIAKKNPHKMMKPWPESGSKSRVAYMTEKDFFGTEKSVTLNEPCDVNIEFVDNDGKVEVLKEKLSLLKKLCDPLSSGRSFISLFVHPSICLPGHL